MVQLIDFSSTTLMDWILFTPYGHNENLKNGPCGLFILVLCVTGRVLGKVHATPQRSINESELKTDTLRNVSLIYTYWQPNVFPLVFDCDECNANDTQVF